MRHACLCCGAGSWQQRFVAVDAHRRPSPFVRCTLCGLLALDGTSDMPGPAEAYDDAYYGGGSTKLIRALHGARTREAARKAARVTRISGGPPGRAFDVGCGEGLFAHAMLRRGWDVDANDVGRIVLARARALTDRALFEADLLEIPVQEGTYDALTMWQVFEHLPRPVETLAAAYRMLKPAGLLVVSVPNTDSWQARLFGRHWLHLDPPRHLHLFSPANLGALLRRHGFEPFLEIRNPLEFGPIGYVQSAMNAAGIRRDAFFDILKTTGAMARHAAVRTAALVAAGALLTPPAVILSLLESAAGHSATFELYARKMAPGRR